MAQTRYTDRPWYWGVDVASQRVDLFMLAPSKSSRGMWVWDHQTLTLPLLTAGAERNFLAAEAMRGFFALWRHVYPPHGIGVEIPMFRGGVNQAIAGIAYAAAAEAWGLTRAPVMEFPPPVWKKTLGLKGNAGKPEVLDWVLNHLAVATEDDNKADAAGVAAAIAARITGVIP